MRSSSLRTVPSRFPFQPFPTGWYAMCFSQELPLRGVRSRWFAGREVVLFRGDSGSVGMLDAHCPHMGAHLGLGGRVVGDVLRCPMHGFQFDAGGRCVATGYDTRPPPKCVARTHQVIERNGIVLAYLPQRAELERAATTGAALQAAWEPPQQDMRGFGPMRTHVFAGVATHPQETTENSVDLGHLSVVHGYEGVQVISPLQTDGPYLTTCYRMLRRPIVRGTPAIDATFTIHVYGLGYSFVDVRVTSHALRARYFVLATPTDAEHIDLQLVGFVGGDGSVLGRIPAMLLDRAVGRLVFHGFLSDVRQDLPIWSNKVCVHPPALAEGDGPIGKYRSWARQFYDAEHEPSEPAVAGASVPTKAINRPS